jgi:roadblock/LC7 domain-containing protein
VTQKAEEYFIVAVYDSHVGAEVAIQALHNEGLDLRRLSIVGKGIETEDHALGYYAPGELMKGRVWRGAAWGALWGLLFGGALFFTFSYSRIASIQPLASWVVGALEAATIGGIAGALATALTSIKIQKNCVVQYEHAVKGGKFAVVVHGTTEMFVHSRAVLETTGTLRLKADAA